MSSLERLLVNSSSSLSQGEPAIQEYLLEYAGALADQLLGMLRRRNGFYALESALHVFPACSSQHELDITDWNEHALWRSRYNGLADGCLFFAEDIFGGQFCLKDGNVYTFDPELGCLDYLAGDIEQWAQTLLHDYEVLTGYPLAHQWQKQNGQLSAGKRVVPKTPFVLGGEFTIDNLHMIDAVEGMRLRADLALQIKELPDGAQIKFDVGE
ncbi:SMI1/KNR4 family protein [Pseudomonas sp. GD04058]|uniref:DUF2625 family protein n=1 Tax=Pseudomonas sp. GD04058 TaxID=2975429 RepID=UPI0024496CCA|nr:DUF2625 family protein [Pseudomonas sp. GD04058]MDG9884249.1 SMI1/KNR4 family protein [Pseudomonas sp. GD04058]